MKMRCSMVAMVFALLAIPTIASAHGGVPYSTPNVIHGCRNANGVLREITSGGCAGDVVVHWNITGPAGPIGPGGPQGPAGATGATGAPGATGTPGTNGTNGLNGTHGTNGINGTNGTHGTNGINGTSVTFVDYFSGSTFQGAPTGCANGGSVYATGNPPVNTYVCNGTNGTNGTNGINGTNGTNATRADPPCFLDNTNRYFDCGNGTVTDTVTGLIWLKQADCLANGNWAAANVAAAALANGECSLTDNSSPGDWRLPTRDEWSATIARAVALGCTGGSGPSLTKNAGTTCFGDGTGSSFAGVASEDYWSSSSNETSATSAWEAYLYGGEVIGAAKFHALRVWPVRGGPR